MGEETKKLIITTVLILFCLWVVWYITGGPERALKERPFLHPLEPLGSGISYGEDINLKTNINIKVPLSSGIEGYVISSPPCKQITYSRCNDTRPMNFKITKKKGETVIEFSMKKDGKFKIPLLPGEYVIWQKSYYKDLPSYQHPMVVEVKSFRYKKVNITFDNSIR